jgi:hypothetical protein
MDDPAVQLRRQINDALPSVATVVCAIIYDYIFPEPHSWTANPARIVGTASATMDMPAVVQRTPTYDKIIQTDATERQPWFSFVSTVDLRSGARQWSVRFIDNTGDNTGGSAIGVTTKTDNFVDPRTSIDDAWTDSWLIQPILYHFIYHGRSIVDTDYAEYSGPAIRWSDAADLPGTAAADFYADPATMRIICRIPASSWTAGRAIVLMTASSMSEFWSLRPVVSLVRKITVVVRSSDS